MTTETVLAGTEEWLNTPLPREFAQGAAPVIDTEAVDECPVCGCSRFEQYAVGFDYELQTCRNPWRLVRCRDCTHVWLNPRPVFAALPVIYPPHYYAYDYEKQVGFLARHGKAMLDGFKMRGIFRARKEPPASFLDVGCGTGRFLRAMKKQGLSPDKIYGIELDPAVVTRLSAEGFRAFCTRVEDCKEIPAGSVDLATMFHVIEHVDNPARVVAQIADWLSPGAVLAVETPNLHSWDANLFQKTYWGGYHIPRHWNLFSPDTLARLLTDQGLEVFDVRYRTGHSFWMYSLHHKLRYGLGLPWLGKRFDPLRGLPFLMMFTALDLVRAKCGFRTSSILMLARKAA
jgi:2-polyprenyl-3-methyl-5-hydroxy-6-metoxy-1,4-benzoquinol methylase